MLRILDRYLIRELSLPFLFGIISFTAILSGSTVLFYLVGDAIKYGMSVWDVLQLFVYKLPSIVVFAFPMSTLLATILVFGRLSADLELIALRSGGLGFYRLVIPVAVFGLFVSLLTIAFNDIIVPRASTSAELLMASYTQSSQPNLKANVNFTQYDESGMPIRIVNVKRIDHAILENVTIAEYESGVLSRVMSAKRGKWLPEGSWEFFDGIMHNFSMHNPLLVTVVQFGYEKINITINPFDLQKREKTNQEMNAIELRRKISLQKRLGQDASESLMNFHLKFSVPFASFIFSLLGACVGVRPARSSSAIGLGISLVIILIYYVLLSIGMGMGMAHVLPAVLCAWMPNVLVGMIALYLLQRVARV